MISTAPTSSASRIDSVITSQDGPATMSLISLRNRSGSAGRSLAEGGGAGVFCSVMRFGLLLRVRALRMSAGHEQAQILARGLRGDDGHDLSSVHHGDPVGHTHHLVQFGGDDENRPALVALG